MLFKKAIPSELASGQSVIVVARWLLVLVGLLVALWHPDPLPQLRVEVAVILLVAIVNFVMHAQLLRRRPTLEVVAYAASLGDLLVISLLVAAQGGFGSQVFVFYFPAFLAIAVAFPTLQAAGLVGIGICLALVAGPNAPDATSEALRALSLAAVAVIGNAYWRLHRAHIQPGTSARRESAADLFWGQVATLWSRWALIVGSTLLVLSRAATTAELAIGILPVVVLLGANFYLHGRYLVERPANATLTLLASGLDLAMLGVLFMSSPGSAGLGNPYYLFLYPIVFGVGLVFAPQVAWPFTAASLLLYALMVVPAGLADQGDLKVLVVRLVTLAAVGGLGSLYWRSVRRVNRISRQDEAHAGLAWEAAGAS